jgi:two-component system cell cycle response regulator DivK
MPTVLVIDDNLLNCEMIRLVLMRANIDTLQATGGNEAMHLFRTYEPDLVITDLYIPKLLGPDGAQVIQLIKSDPLRGHIPVIALTAVASSEVRRAAYDAGCDVFLPKPFRPSHLIQVVQELLRLKAGV